MNVKMGRKLIASDIRPGTKFVIESDGNPYRYIYTIKTTSPIEGTYIPVALSYTSSRNGSGNTRGNWIAGSDWYLIKSVKNIPQTEI